MEFSNLLWSIPFLGIIFSMSFLPLLCEKFWHRYGGAVPFFWSAVYLFFIGREFGAEKIIPAILEPMCAHYIPFIVLIAALYIVSGGIFVDFPRGRGPLFNTCFLFFSSILAGWIGTTGAATLLIRPLLRVNASRKYKTHILVFFIFLVSNVGGASTPLGDPPLFIGFIEGVDFFWFIKNLYPYIFATIFVLCLIFFAMDSYLFKRDHEVVEVEKNEKPFIVGGVRNIFLILMILVAVIFCNFKGEFSIFGEKFSFSSVVRNIIIGAIALISIKITPVTVRKKNCFSYGPIREVAELFIGIFITVAPIIDILHQGLDGQLRFVFEWIAPGGQFAADRCFWASGLLSSMLDNAPTFLIFFHMTSGNALELMTTKAHILAAISISTVFMGAMTYIGNAPNLMVKSISTHYGIKAPSFIGYMLWSTVILVPLFFIIASRL